MDKQYADTLMHFVQEELLNGQTVVDIDDDLLSEGMIDSMGIMWLLSYIESEFSIAVPPEDVTIEHFRSVAAVAEYVTKRAKRENGDQG